MRRAHRWPRELQPFLGHVCTDIVFDWSLRLIVTAQGQGRVRVGRYLKMNARTGERCRHDHERVISDPVEV